MRAAAAMPMTPAAEPAKAKLVAIAPESEFVVVTLFPLESVVVATVLPVACATLMPYEVLTDVIWLPALSVMVRVVVAVAVVEAVQADQLVQGGAEPHEFSVQPVGSTLAMLL